MKPNGHRGCHLFVFRSHPRVLTRFGNVTSGSNFFGVWLVLLFISLTKGIVYGREDLISHPDTVQWETRVSQMPPQSHSRADYEREPLLNAEPEEYWSGKEVLLFRSKKNWPNLKKTAIPRHNRDPILRLILGRQQKEMDSQKAPMERKSRAESRINQKVFKVNNERQKRTGKTSYKTQQERETIEEKEEEAKKEEEKTDNEKEIKEKSAGEKDNKENQKPAKEMEKKLHEPKMKSNKRSGRSAQGASRLQLVDGKYEGIVVRVSEKISQEDCRDVIQGLQASVREMSSSLHVATHGRATIGRITVVLPNQWSTRACHTPSMDAATPDDAAAAAASPHQPQIVVDTPHALFGDAPWTQQSAGCGKQGDFISMGVNFLKEANSSVELALRAGRVLAGEWAKFRWGVFSEIGYSGDPLYPPWYVKDTEWAPTLCSDISSHSPPCHPELSHRCPWPPKALTNASSSLLSTPNLPHVSLFCTNRTHNTRAPTKQNTLCRGRSAWEVIAASPDFAGGRNPPGTAPLRPPEIVFVKPTPLRFVLLIENSAVMIEQRRWEFVRKAVRRTVVYDLPDDAHVSVVVFNAEPSEVAPLAKLESDSDLRERVGSSLPRNPSSVRASQACIKCAIEAAIKVLRAAKVSEKGANIVLLTSGEQSRANEVEQVSNLLQTYGLRLLLVLYPFQEYPGRPAPSHSLAPFAKSSGGSVFTVMDEGVGTDSKVSMLVALMEALTAAVAQGGAPTPVLVHLATYPGGVAPLSTGTFSLDESLASNAKFSVYYYDLNHVGNTIRLTAPSGSTFASVSMQEEDGDVNMIFVNLNNAERGIWHYKVENRADSHQGLYIQVTSFPNPENDVKVRVWTNQNSADHVTSSEEPIPIIIYGEVKVNGLPVMGAGVMAILQRLGTNATGGTYPPVKVPLLDLGTGEPDITRGDGIYSRYSPPLDGPARYSLTLSVDASKAVIGQAASHTHSKEHDHRHHRHAYVKENLKKTPTSSSSSATSYSSSSPFSSSSSPSSYSSSTSISSPSSYPFTSSSYSYGLSSSISSSFYSYYENPTRRGWDTSGGSSMGPSGCCGSTLQYPHTRQSPPFTRQVTGPTIDSRVVYNSRIDNTAPARISDLIAWVNSSTGRVVLEWTAVGNDYDWGRAHRYQGAVTSSIEEASSRCTGHVLQGLPDPMPAAARETISIHLEINEKKTLYVCMRAFDKSGNAGPPSNAAAVWLPRPPSIDRVTVRARGSGFSSYGASGVGENVAVISGCLGGVLLVVVMVAAYCYCVPVAFKRRLKIRRREPKVNGKEGEKAENGSERNLINGGSILMKSSSRKSAFASSGSESDRKDRLAATSFDGSPDDVGPSHGGHRESGEGEEGGSQETLRLSMEMNNSHVDLGLNENFADGSLETSDSLNSGRRGLSMSIPDVTRVDPQRSLSSPQNDPHIAPQPQFFTLGRRSNNHHQTPSRRSPYFDMARSDLHQQQPLHQSLFGPQKEAPDDLHLKMSVATASQPMGPGGAFVGGVAFRPTTPTQHQHRRQSMHESDSSLYGSQEGDSVMDILLCDDRTASPPPPAPSGPDGSPAVAFLVKRHTVAFP